MGDVHSLSICGTLVRELLVQRGRRIKGFGGGRWFRVVQQDTHLLGHDPSSLQQRTTPLPQDVTNWATEETAELLK